MKETVRTKTVMKLSTGSADQILELAEKILGIYQGYRSPLIENETEGFHLFITLEPARGESEPP